MMLINDNDVLRPLLSFVSHFIP